LLEEPIAGEGRARVGEQALRLVEPRAAQRAPPDGDLPLLRARRVRLDDDDVLGVRVQPHQELERVARLAVQVQPQPARRDDVERELHGYAHLHAELISTTGERLHAQIVDPPRYELAVPTRSEAAARAV